MLLGVSWADAFQAVGSVVGSLLTIIAVGYAIKSGNDNSRLTKQSAEIAQNTFLESVENRKDDSMPVLEYYKQMRLSGENPRTGVHLENIGNGPLFGLTVHTPQSSENIIMFESNEGKEKYYTIYILKDELQKMKTKVIRYRYLDMYGRTFEMGQYFTIDEAGSVTITPRFTLPKKISEK